MNEGHNDGFIMIADRRLQQGDLYRVKEALLNAGIEKNTDAFKDYVIRCAQQVLKLLREDKIVYIESRSQWDMFNKMDKMTKEGKEELGSLPKEVIEVLESFGVEITKEDYELLAEAAMKKFIADLNTSCSAVKSDPDYRQECLDEVNRIRELAGLSKVSSSSISSEPHLIKSGWVC